MRCVHCVVQLVVRIVICGARRALQESMPSNAVRHTCCSCALLAGTSGRARCADAAQDPQRAARAAAAAPLACSAGSALGVRRRVYPARGARYKCTIGFLQRMVVSALHAPPVQPTDTVALSTFCALNTAGRQPPIEPIIAVQYSIYSYGRVHPGNV